ncbi:MAG: AbrB/MazE/SpoVT family DNA-binding domain-containing protein [Clostridiales Family XIII bacterium]|jgi:antitoxin MazE|nr:AbrB/MazE/SpoVT family DNA-binding domain-containing protein [Clostridiales Family XIII bacterium]
MAKTATVTKWGNARGIRLPESFCRQLGISAGDKVSLTIEKNRLVVAPADERYTLRARLAAWDGAGAPEPEYDWGTPVGKELW